MSETRRPLILTRPQAASEAFAKRLEPWLPSQVEVIVSPLLELVPTGAVPDTLGVERVIFSSPNGVLFSPPGSHPAYCVGDETTRIACKHGWVAQKVGNTSAELVTALKKMRDLGPMLHISGVHTRGNITGHLNTAGIAAQHVAVYDQELRELSEYALNSLRRGIEPIIPLFSPRTARQFAKQGGITVPPHLVAISETVMKETNGIAATTRTVSGLPNASAMEETLRDVIERLEA